MKNLITDYLVKLTETDRLILASYCTLCECLSTCLGSAYEIVVHSLGVGDRFIQEIVNGQYSGRSEEDGVDNSFIVATEQLCARIKHDDQPITVCFGTSKNGGMFKSASIGIVGSGKRLIGMMCLNFYLNTPFSEILESYALPRYLAANNSPYSAYENRGYDSILYDTIKNAKQSVMDDPDIPSKYKKKEIIRRLNEAGVFKIKNGVSICAEMLGVTITTIYMHIRKLGLSPEKL